MREGKQLQNKMPKLGDELLLEEEGTEVNLRQVTAMIKWNAIPTKTVRLGSKW